MNYHNITKDDMLNGSGLRVVLWVSGCSHHCNNCHNQETWNPKSGIEFDISAKEKIFNLLDKDYINGITFSGGDPLHNNNAQIILRLIVEIKDKFPNKNIWLYTGYSWEDLQKEENTLKRAVIQLCDVLVDGEFQENLSDINYHWAGSTNQRIIDVQKSLFDNKIVIYKD